MIDGEGFNRQTIPINRLRLTAQTVKIGRGIRSGKLSKIISKENIQQKFNESSFGKSLNRQEKRQKLNDFERFKVLALRRKLSRLLRARVNKKVAKKK